MTIISPHANLYHRRRLMQRSTGELGFYAVSHVWGNVGDMWDVGNFIHENDRPVNPIPMRPEKRNTLLALLRSHPDSYWWIDVLCVDKNTPLGMMRDIYSHCNSCIILLDCHPMTIERLSDPCIEKMWDTLNSIRDAYAFGHPNAKTQATDFARIYETELAALSALVNCQWWNRVWTWQEVVLPGWGFMLAEQSGTHHSVDLFALKEIARMINEMSYSFGAECEIVSLFQGTMQLQKMWNELSTTADMGSRMMKAKCVNNHNPIDLFATLAQSSRRCMDPVDYVYGVLGLLQMDIPRTNDPRAVWTYFLSQVDDLITSWLHNRERHHYESGNHIAAITVSERAKNFDLSKANDMADVYSNLLHVEYTTSSLQDV
ncbi:hypothetical protein K492DRAFT_184893 [Lichtheimia hyalospora FSU 10163]|nr:hypothetical protein K492DRAFT_184893 [Lichtheimia hyalospora FSU 10163]